MTTQNLAEHAREGLSAPQKYLSSRWFYDDEGSKLFQEIMELPGYYLTRIEQSLLDSRVEDLARLITADGPGVDVIELGSGDGLKVSLLLETLHRTQPGLVFHPIDVSQHALELLTARFDRLIPTLEVRSVLGDYRQTWPQVDPSRRQVVLFLGSNLGNFDGTGAASLLKYFREKLRPGDALVIGVDLVKDPAIILSAYDDLQGVTARFNLNLLRRLNRELGMDFDLTQFRHYATYSPIDGAVRSFLVSLRDQTVRSTVLRRDFFFKSGETLYTEQSQKYQRTSIASLVEMAGFSVKAFITDPRDWYAVVVCTV